MARLLRFAIAAGTSTAIILLLTYGVVSVHLWPDGPPTGLGYFAGGFVFLPVIVGFVAGAWLAPRQDRSVAAVGTTGAVIGLAYGYLMPRVGLLLSFYEFRYWRNLVPLSLIDIQGLVCGVVAATCALLLSVTVRSRFVFAAVAGLIFAGIFLPSPMYDLIGQNEELTVVVVAPDGTGTANPPSRIAEGSGPTVPDVTSNIWSTPVDASAISNHVLSLLRNEGIAGQYKVTVIWRGGHGKQALAALVFNQTVVSEVKLPEPRGGEVIYLQRPDGWKKIPPQHPTLRRSIEVKLPPDDWALGALRIWGAGGRGISFAIVKTTESVASHK
jgi:hypothetical protein